MSQALFATRMHHIDKVGEDLMLMIVKPDMIILFVAYSVHNKLEAFAVLLRWCNEIKLSRMFPITDYL